MKRLILTSLVCAVMSAGALAQTATTAPPEPVPAPSTPADASVPVPGANSFTESQARNRLEVNGYSNIVDLKKDASGVWRATATHANATVQVSLDYQGNIANH